MKDIAVSPPLPPYPDRSPSAASARRHDGKKMRLAAAGANCHYYCQCYCYADTRPHAPTAVNGHYFRV